MKHHFTHQWEKELNKLKSLNLKRSLHRDSLLDFSSNDYLSLAQHNSIRKSLIQALKNNLPLSSGASRLVRGTTLWHENTEKIFQKWIGRPALFFSSGYLANLGIISTLCKNAVIFSDRLNHASLIDGCRLSQSTCHIYAHKNTHELESYLKKYKHKKNKVIITESLFSMDGDFAPLEDISYLALKHQALLIVDEAHSIGVYGPQGKGLCKSLKNQDHIVAVYPCGKALSSHGSFVVGPEVLKQYLINKCRPFIYTTAPSPISLFHIQCVINTLINSPNRLKSLKKKALFFRQLIKDLNVYGDKDSVIVPVITGSATSAISLEKALKKEGFGVRAIRYPSVPKGEERIRICIHYNHTYKQLSSLADHLKEKARVPRGEFRPACNSSK